MSSVTGSCMCGLVSYTMSAEPLLSAICHCRDCQKQTGTSFSLVLGIPRDSFKITGDLSTYETIGMSGSKVKRKFCGNCGSPMYSDADAFEGLLFVKSGTLDDPSGLVPTMEIFCDDAQEWCKFAVQLDRVAKNPPSA